MPGMWGDARMVDLRYCNLRWVVHNLITCPTHPKIEHMISDYLDEYPEDLERLREIIDKAHAVIKKCPECEVMLEW